MPVERLADARGATPPPRRIALALALLLAAGSFFFFFRLGAVSLRMWDEARVAVNALEMLQHGNLVVTYYDGAPDMWNTKPPLLIWMMAGSMRVFGANEFAARLPSALAGLGAVVLVFLFCAWCLSDPRAGVCAGFVLMTSVGFVVEHVTRTADYDGVLTFFVTAYALGFFWYLEPDAAASRPRVLVMTAVAAGLAVLTKGIAGLMCMPGLLLYTLFRRRLRPLLSSGPFLIAIAAVLGLSAAYYLMREHLNPGYIRVAVDAELLRYGTTLEGHTGGPLFYLRDLFRVKFVPWAYLLPCCVLVTLFSHSSRTRRFGLFGVLFLSCYLIVITAARTKLPWYDAPLYPIAALAVGLGLSEGMKALAPRLNLAVLDGRTGSALLFAALFSIPVADMAYSRIYLRSGMLYPWSTGPDEALDYGDYLKRLRQERPAIRAIRVVNDDYNSHLVFYADAANAAGYDVEIAGSAAALPAGRPLVTCAAAIREKLAALPAARMLHSSRSCATYEVRGGG